MENYRTLNNITASQRVYKLYEQARKGFIVGLSTSALAALAALRVEGLSNYGSASSGEFYGTIGTVFAVSLGVVSASAFGYAVTKMNKAEKIDKAQKRTTIPEQPIKLSTAYNWANDHEFNDSDLNPHVNAFEDAINGIIYDKPKGEVIDIEPYLDGKRK